MSDLDADFDAAVTAVSSQTNDPGNDVKLRLYALSKQATLGDVEGRRPGFANPVGRAKYDSWASVSGMSDAAAKKAYVQLVAQLDR
jgi:diazepam-binding inhibitor (GABA receptor modulator, acyl-CoA-binding protein)